MAQWPSFLPQLSDAVDPITDQPGIAPDPVPTGPAGGSAFAPSQPQQGNWVQTLAPMLMAAGALTGPAQNRNARALMFMQAMKDFQARQSSDELGRVQADYAAAIEHANGDPSKAAQLFGLAARTYRTPEAAKQALTLQGGLRDKALAYQASKSDESAIATFQGEMSEGRRMPPLAVYMRMRQLGASDAVAKEMAAQAEKGKLGQFNSGPVVGGFDPYTNEAKPAYVAPEMKTVNDRLIEATPGVPGLNSGPSAREVGRFPSDYNLSQGEKRMAGGTNDVLAENKKPLAVTEGTRAQIEAKAGELGVSPEYFLERVQANDPLYLKHFGDAGQISLAPKPTLDQMKELATVTPGITAAQARDPQAHLNAASKMLEQKMLQGINTSVAAAVAKAKAERGLEAGDVSTGRNGRIYFDQVTGHPVAVTKEQERSGQGFAAAGKGTTVELLPDDAKTAHLIISEMPKNLDALDRLNQKLLATAKGANIPAKGRIELNKLLGDADAKQYVELMRLTNVGSARIQGGSSRVPVTMLKQLEESFSLDRATLAAAMRLTGTVRTDMNNRLREIFQVKDKNLKTQWGAGLEDIDTGAAPGTTSKTKFGDLKY